MPKPHNLENVTRSENEERYINMKEAAAFLSIPVNTAYKMCLSRVLPSYKLGKLRRLKLSEIIAFAEAGRVEAKPSR